MKKIMIIMLMAIVSTGLYASKNTEVNYVKVNGQTYFATDIQFGWTKAKLVNENGGITKFDYSELEAVMFNGKLYERMPVEGVSNAKKPFMECLTARNGLKLYRYCGERGKCNLLMTEAEKENMDFDYYVFKDGAMYLKVTPENASTVLPFFGVQVKS
jgi:hypothetical protein